MRLRSDPYKFFILAHLLCTIFCLVVLRLYSPLEHWMCVLLALNCSAFVMCGWDKSVAGGTDERIPEQVLYGIALTGGSIGLLLGMNFFRHKTKKDSFQFVVGVIVAIQLLLIKTFKF